MAQNDLAPLSSLLTSHFHSTLQVDDFAQGIEGIVTLRGHTSGELSLDMEIVFREQLLELLGKTNAKDIVTRGEGSDVVKLLSFAFACGVHDASTTSSRFSSSCKRVPFLLIEDLLEGQTIAHAEAIWGIVEGLMDKLTHPELFAKGHHILLRVCNSLLRRLSKACNTELCGRVLMFLAAIFDISARSAVNLYGKYNVSNVTSIESEEVFNALHKPPVPEAAAATGADEAAAAAAAGGGGGVGEEEEESTAATKKSKTNDGKAKSTATTTATTTTTTTAAAAAGDGKDDASSAALTYAEYSSFWSLQNFFAQEVKATELPALLKCATQVLTKFEKKAAPPLDRQLEAKKLNDAKSKAASSPFVFDSLTSSSSSSSSSSAAHDEGSSSSSDKSIYLGCKFLTSSKLFSLQIRDPLLRQQVCTQLLFLTHSLRAKPPIPPTITSSSSSSSSGKGEASSTTMTNEQKAHTFAVSLLRDLKNIENRSFAVIESTNRGKELSAVIKRLLYREGFWLQWKASSCPAFERLPVAISPLPSALPLLSQAAIAAATSSSKKPPPQSYNFGKTFDESVASARALAEQIPTFTSHMEQYLDAEDPDAGIDDEYHPKHDVVYCWRARRLMAEQGLTSFEAMTDGNLSVGLAALKEPPSSSTATDIYSCLGVAKSLPPVVVPPASASKNKERQQQNEEKGQESGDVVVKSSELETAAASSSYSPALADSVEMAVDGEETEAAAASASAQEVVATEEDVKFEGPMPLPPKEEGEEGEEVEEEQPKHKKHKVKHERR